MNSTNLLRLFMVFLSIVLAAMITLLDGSVGHFSFSFWHFVLRFFMFIIVFAGIEYLNIMSLKRTVNRILDILIKDFPKNNVEQNLKKSSKTSLFERKNKT